VIAKVAFENVPAKFFFDVFYNPSPHSFLLFVLQHYRSKCLQQFVRCFILLFTSLKIMKK